MFKELQTKIKIGLKNHKNIRFAIVGIVTIVTIGLVFSASLILKNNFDQKVAQAALKCPAGYNPSSNQCVSIAPTDYTCPSGGSREGTNCVTRELSCPSGTSLDNSSSLCKGVRSNLGSSPCVGIEAEKIGNSGVTYCVVVIPVRSNNYSFSGLCNAQFDINDLSNNYPVSSFFTSGNGFLGYGPSSTSCYSSSRISFDADLFAGKFNILIRLKDVISEI